WETVVGMIPEKPMLGWGEVGYRSELERLVETKKADPVVLKLANTHNNYLEIWVLHGLVGLLPILALFLSSFVMFCRRLRSSNPAARALALCGSSLIGAYGVFCLSQNMLCRNNSR